jgi:hypothetical protein
LRHQLKRPYISHRYSAVHGDPLNNAEVLTTRVLSWGAVLFCLRLLLTSKLGKDLGWLVTCLAMALLAALAYSQMQLFRGLVDDVKHSVGRFGSFGSFGGENDSGGGGRARGNSALRDIGVSKKLEDMLECKSAIEMWKLQKSLKGPLLLESERARWVIKEHRNAVSLLRRVLVLLGSVLGALVLLMFVIVLTWVLSTSDACLLGLALLVVGSVVGMEVYLARNVAVAKGAMTMEEWAAKEREENGDDDDDFFEVEMATVNPVARLASTTGASAKSEPAESKDGVEVQL